MLQSAPAFALLFLIASSASACVIADDASDPAQPGERGSPGKADQRGSCEGTLCDGQSPSGPCWCDDLCTGYSDCCADYEPVCHGAPADSDDPFDPASCTGAQISLEEMVELFDQGASETELGEYKMLKRSAKCTALTGCDQSAVEEMTVHTMWAGSTHSQKRSVTGMAGLAIEGESVALRLEGGAKEGARCTIGSGIRCGTYSYLSSQQWGGSGGYFDYYSNLRIGSPRSDVRLAGVITSDCLRLSYRITSDQADEEVALLVRF